MVLTRSIVLDEKWTHAVGILRIQTLGLGGSFGFDWYAIRAPVSLVWSVLAGYDWCILKCEGLHSRDAAGGVQVRVDESHQGTARGGGGILGLDAILSVDS